MLRPKWKVIISSCHQKIDVKQWALACGHQPWGLTDFWTCFKKGVNTYGFWHWQSLNHLSSITLLNRMWPVVLKVWPPTNCISTPGIGQKCSCLNPTWNLNQKLWGGTQQSVLTHSPCSSLRTAVLCFVEMSTVKLQIYLFQKKSVKTDAVNILKHFEISYL